MTQREEFETWYCANKWTIDSTLHNLDGVYTTPAIQLAWTAWQATQAAQSSKAEQVEPKPLTYAQAHLQGFTCTKVEDASGKERLTIYKTKLGDHSEHQLYDDEALALWVNIGKALGPEYTSASPQPSQATERYMLMHQDGVGKSYMVLDPDGNWTPFVAQPSQADIPTPPVVVKNPANSDELYDKAVAIVKEHQRASISLVQRHLRISYNKAAMLLEEMANAGLIASNGNGSYSLAAINAKGTP